MKVRVVKAFTDKKAGGRVRFEGSIYETSMERAAELNLAGYVKLLEPPLEYNVPVASGETKKGRPPGLTTVKKKRRTKK